MPKQPTRRPPPETATATARRRAKPSPASGLFYFLGDRIICGICLRNGEFLRTSIVPVIRCQNYQCAQHRVKYELQVVHLRVLSETRAARKATLAGWPKRAEGGKP
jgi:hypothetical protein